MALGNGRSPAITALIGLGRGRDLAVSSIAASAKELTVTAGPVVSGCPAVLLSLSNRSWKERRVVSACLTGIARVRARALLSLQ